MLLLIKGMLKNFFFIAESKLEDPANRQAVLSGLRLGAYLFHRLYQDLYIESLTLPKFQI